jgi:hypothetical protein
MKGNLNSQTTFMVGLMRNMLLDVCNRHEYPLLEANRDIKLISRRTLSEGMSFLTKTLPALGKAVDSGLLSGMYQCPSAFKKRKGTRLPCFLYGLLIQVFTSSGNVREDACVHAISTLRQLAFVFYKYELDYTDDIVGSFLDNFVACDHMCERPPMNPEVMASIFYAQETVNTLFKEFCLDEIALKNGPGVSATGVETWERYRPSQFYPELDALYPYHISYYYNQRHLFDDWEQYWDLPYQGDHGTSKLMMVPKDSRGPRIISAEPHEKMAYQQALRCPLYQYIESHPITRGQVNFTDQRINGELALSGSIDGRWATLDLKSASDLLSLTLVEDLFNETSIWQWLKNSRSANIETPNGTRELKKYAPMGNALTFPVQAICYYSLIVGRFIALGMPRQQAFRSVFVYGDDIIVPIWLTDEAIDVLTINGLLVNESKSCSNGYFRESCGVDAYKGVDVTPQKLKKVWTRNPDITVLTAYVAYSNYFHREAWWHASTYLDKLITSQVGWLPLVSSTSPIMGFTTWSNDHIREANAHKLRYSSKLQRDEIKGLKPYSRPKDRRMNGWERLNRFAWDADPERTEAFPTGSFTVRRTVNKKHVVVGLHELMSPLEHQNGSNPSGPKRVRELQPHLSCSR